MNVGMTKRQAEALRFVRGYTLKKRMAPSIDEIRAGVCLRSCSGVIRLLAALEERGHIRRPAVEPGYRIRQFRAIEVLTDIPIPRSPDGEPLYFVGVGQ